MVTDMKNPVAREAGKDTAPAETQPSLDSLRQAAPLATGPLYCWYDDGRPAAAFIEVTAAMTPSPSSAPVWRRWLPVPFLWRWTLSVARDHAHKKMVRLTAPVPDAAQMELAV